MVPGLIVGMCKRLLSERIVTGLRSLEQAHPGTQVRDFLFKTQNKGEKRC
jgi:hypothetical protein